MVVDAVRTYLEAASGLTELTRKRAVAAAKTLLKESDERSGGTMTRVADTAKSTLENVEGSVRGMRVGHSIQALAVDLVETSRANRAALSTLVEGEVERLLGRLDLVRRDEHDRLARRVAELERRLAAPSAAQRRRAAEEVQQAVPAAVVEQVQVPEPARAPEPVVVEPEVVAAPPAAVEPEQRSAVVSEPAADESTVAVSVRTPAAPVAVRGAKAKVTGTRSRSAKGSTKRAVTRKNSGAAKDGSQ